MSADRQYWRNPRYRFKIIAPAPENPGRILHGSASLSVCERCPVPNGFVRCRARSNSFLPALCEKIDENDVVRVKAIYGENGMELLMPAKKRRGTCVCRRYRGTKRCDTDADEGGRGDGPTGGVRDA